ncbi:hypothetical protein SAMN04487983_1021124 [Streptomyces sp. yr375]|uniref:hypothetical protein n=1 Tax=Streptomyces sp. yr375 TaxID=1761906 RepID=UPI0008BF709F|nr:hypothetical protein [Streptomyces sp. yr375]SER75973.1 hypothetical protein SAMN04487983_1021124 [Streptomyces sp. yr375]
MSLWDVRASEWGEVLEGISPLERGEISREVVKGSLGFFRPSFDEVFAEDTVRFVRSVLGESARPGGVDSVEADEISGRLYTLAEQDPAIGTASLAAALSLFFDCAATDFDAESVLEILSACYEAVLHTEGLSQEVLESETDNDNCSRLIDFQWEVITRFA